VLVRVICMLLFVGWTGEWPLDRDPTLYCGLWRSPLVALGPLFVSIPGLSLFPWQIILLGMVPVGLLRPGAFRKRALILDAAILASLLSIGITYLWGWMRGGSAYQAYYQLWRFLAALVVGLLLHSTIRGSRDLRALGVTVVLAALIRATLVEYFYWAYVHGKLDPPPPFMTNHDDSLLFVGAVVILLSWAILRGGHLRWLATVLAISHLLYAIVLNNRRLAWIELVFALGLMYAMLPKGGWRRRVNRWMPILGPLLLVYIIVGEGREGAVFAPANALATAGSNQDSSSLARQEEIRNLLFTLVNSRNPLFGTGWGVPYSEASSIYTHFGGTFWQYPYLPHNSLLGVIAFAGLVGLAGIWVVVPVTAFLATRGYRGATRPIDRIAAMAIVCFLPAYGVQCYGDIGFQSFAGGMLLGVAMGGAGKLSAWAEAAARERRRAAGTVADAPAVLLAGGE
jgi:hypothetical protein